LTFIETACQAGYTSTAEFGMMEDLGMSIAAVSFFFLFIFIYNWHSMATSNVSLIFFFSPGLFCFLIFCSTRFLVQ
jgi:hypothetical protein